MKPFAVGDHVEIVSLGNAELVFSVIVGMPTTIIEASDKVAHGWILDLDSPQIPGSKVVAQECVLRHLDDPYDGLEKTSWDELPWMPQELVRVS